MHETLTTRDKKAVSNFKTQQIRETVAASKKHVYSNEYLHGSNATGSSMGMPSRLTQPWDNYFAAGQGSDMQTEY